MSANIPSLSLYHFQSCPYCAMTRRAMNGLGLDIEQRDVLNQPHFRAELIKQGGKSQVPCLRIDNGDGEVEWLYESMDIIEYLRRYAETTATTSA